jgi:hypothetical protein
MEWKAGEMLTPMDQSQKSVYKFCVSTSRFQQLLSRLVSTGFQHFLLLDFRQEYLPTEFHLFIIPANPVTLIKNGYVLSDWKSLFAVS